MRGYIFYGKWQKKVDIRWVVVCFVKEIIKRVKVARLLPFTFEKVYEKDFKSPFQPFFMEL